MKKENLVKARKLANKTQEDVALFLNIKRQTYSAYERGISKPDPDTLSALADYFNVSVDYLLGRSDIPNAANPAVANKDTLSQKKRDIIEKLMLLSDEDLEILEAAADAIIARRDK